jgi:hypothetical protein
MLHLKTEAEQLLWASVYGSEYHRLCVRIAASGDGVQPGAPWANGSALSGNDAAFSAGERADNAVKSLRARTPPADPGPAAG